ncbi:leucyl aminopeptidase [Phreatobacter cathodiphilus]|uniref:Probable cytosol aminopeptidase n=1 Tax=Phreatobacter cathodiphilus TaxID=1868589 RepID=A0A2S0N945_9HYPH|nr:leucyl aminopeptidase [Phreatobacter cathodiphilus]AVO44537.1 leucyl aminopeptidase [Phreatobacter cathodiphilus]
MPDTLKISFAPLSAPVTGLLVCLVGEDMALPEAASLPATAGALFERAAAQDGFKGKAGGFLDIIAPEKLAASRLIAAGIGKAADWKELDVIKLGGAICARLPDAATEASVVVATASGALSADQAADLALGLRLRFYSFDRYKTKKKEGEAGSRKRSVTLLVADEKAARKAFKAREAVADGVDVARDLVNEPPNVLFPTEFAKRAGDLARLGVDVEVLNEKDLKKLGMGALLAVGQGSARDSHVVVMRWDGGKDGEAPVCLVGKGVCFDSGGISLKPGEGMQDMKGDMGGAAAVVGAMHALAARKARANVVGLIGLVENMPDGNAYRPGDILTSMSGQTIEMINTDAEGRLVLADVLWYAKDRFKPKAMVNLATLTGAIMVALGQENAGLFSNNDDVAKALTEAGLTTGEKVWRMPLSAEYDKLIDSQFADMKNTGGRYGGAITAAQFLQRFVGDVPWAHLDVAGTAMNSSKGDINRSWGAGWGVRLLDRFVADGYER